MYVCMCISPCLRQGGRTICYILYSILYTLYTIHYTLYTIHYTLYTIHYTLYTYLVNVRVVEPYVARGHAQHRGGAVEDEGGEALHGCITIIVTIIHHILHMHTKDAYYSDT
jgi:hypothetical protein